jgi:hypothetical protein
LDSSNEVLCISPPHCISAPYLPSKKGEQQKVKDELKGE